MEARVDGDDGDLCPAVVVREAVETFEQGARGGGDHARVDGRVRDIDDEDVDRRLWRANLNSSRTHRDQRTGAHLNASLALARATHHVLGRGDKLDDSRVELRALVAVRGLVLLLVPVEQLRHLVREVAHAALPPLPALDERHVGVDVGPAATTARDDRVRDDWDRVL